MNKNYYNTVLSQTFSPCGNYLIVGDIYGQILTFHIAKIIKPDLNASKQERAPKNTILVEEDIQINSLVTTTNFLIVGTRGYLYGYQWKAVKGTKDAKPSWKYDLPILKDKLEKCDVNCIVYDKDGEVLYVGCGDNNVYVINIETGATVNTLSKHSNYIHSLYKNGNELISGGEDGLVCIWDLRRKAVSNKIEPFKNDKLGRPELGKWIGAIYCNDDLLICGGGPRLSMWYLRTLNTSTVFPIEDRGIHVVNLCDNNVLAGGSSEYFYQMSLNGDIISEIPTSSASIYSAAYQLEPFTVLCLAGSSPKIDICSNFNYRDQVLSIY
ncbi:THO complex subunit 6 [Onthophagus taurus]|uniref:THO complex subunit 6 n=1 Tax=Onthophagus taurus TaxID=166361 RepID=UPI000C20AD4F|nr:THO complex subunit 6 [Onthophagus taurus]